KKSYKNWMVLTMKNNNYGSMRAFFVTGVLAFSCATAHAEGVHHFAASTTLADRQTSQPETTATLVEFNEIRSAADMALYLEGMEADFGPFDVRLGEPMLRAGDLLAESGDYLQARNFLERALHV